MLVAINLGIDNLVAGIGSGYPDSDAKNNQLHKNAAV